MYMVDEVQCTDCAYENLKRCNVLIKYLAIATPVMENHETILFGDVHVA